MSGARRLLLAAAIAPAICIGAPHAFADALSEANALIIDDPSNIDLNLDYALIAEGQGKYRLALAAYERILLNHPDNADAKRGLVRVRRIIQPPSTQIFVEAGAKWESNAEHAPDGEEDDFLGYARIRLKDERPVNGMRWRTVGSVYGEAHTESDSLNYANVSATIGPIVDLGASMVSAHPAIGGGAAMIEDRFYYADVNASLTFEGYLEGAYQWARFRAGYRQYDEELTSEDGFYLDASGKFAWSDVIVGNDAVSIAPLIRWNEIDGTFNDTVNDFSPGRYVVGGVKLAYDRVLNDLLTVGISVEVEDRYFLVDVAPSGDHRQDVTIAPGASILFKDVFGPQTGLRFDYEYQFNDSNDPAHDYDNHVLGVALVARR
jgi:hypothetical protein